MTDIVYIIVSELLSTFMIESVWSTKELADAAILYHKFHYEHESSSKFTLQIIERRINTTTK